MLKSEVLVSTLTSLGLLFFSTFAQADNPTEVMLPAGGVRVVVGFSPEGSAQKAILDRSAAVVQNYREALRKFHLRYRAL